MKKLISLTLIAFFFISCNGELKVSKEFMGANAEDEDEVIMANKVEMIFSDPTVTNFMQTSGFAKANNTPIDYLIPKAIAGGGNVSCFVGEYVSFSMDVFGNTLDLETICTNNIEKNIRFLLLKSFVGKKVRRTVTADTYNDQDVVLNLQHSSGVWDRKFSIARNGGRPCEAFYEFNRINGVAEFSAEDESHQVSYRTGQNCGGAFSKNVSFRFNNGYLELDLSNTENFSAGNVYTDENGNLAPSYERYEICDEPLSNDDLPTSIGDAAINLDSVRDSVDVYDGNKIDCTGYAVAV